jgi:6-phosphogluconate dehydrogenase
MNIGMVGLGRMGLNMSKRLLRGGHKVAGFDLSAEARAALAKDGGVPAASLEELVSKLEAPRHLWIMLPAGAVTEQAVEALSKLLSKGDLLVDGGNTYYKDDVRRSKALAEKGVRYMDVGVSGGIWGLENGYCMMAGGERADFDRLTPVLKTLAPADGFLFCGAPGAGHFVKMIHNGIEYGMMQAYAEGFHIIEASPYKQDNAKLAGLWNRGSVVRSWLLELAEQAFREDPKLDSLVGPVSDSGEGRWTVEEAVALGVPAPVITESLYARFASQQKASFSHRVLNALRAKFGGHKISK